MCPTGELQRNRVYYYRLDDSRFKDTLERIRIASTENGKRLQLFRQRLSKKSVKTYATMPKGSLGNTQQSLNKHVKSSESILFLLTHANKYS